MVGGRSRTPDQAQVALSRVFQLIEQAQPALATAPQADDVVSQLERLARLLDSGHVTAEEFAQLKKRLLTD